MAANRDIPNRNCFAVDYDALTPMMQHYVAVKREHPQALLLYRVGDFFETFFQDACTIAETLELTLTSKEAGKTVGRVPMAGVPHHAIERYCAQLVERGYAVALCDQIQDPSEAQGLVERAVTRILTPGTVIEAGMLAARRNNYLAAVVTVRHSWGLAHADISTGEFWTTQGEDLEALTQELLRLQPAEVLYPVNAPDLVGLLRPGEDRTPWRDRGELIPEALPSQFCYALRPQIAFDFNGAKQRLFDRFRVRSLEGFGCDRQPLAVRAAGGLLAYLDDTFQGGRDRRNLQSEATPAGVDLLPLRTYTLTDYLILDHQTRRNLEIIQTVRDGTLTGSLLWALDETVTAMGGRSLRRWLLQPLLDIEGIRSRQRTIAELVSSTQMRQDLQRLLRDIYDLERLAGRASAGTANARDLVALADSLAKVPDLVTVTEGARSPYLRALARPQQDLEQLAARLRSHLVESPPLKLTEGGLIREGVHEQLDRLRHQAKADLDWLANLEAEERQRTGIATLKVGYNKTFGYYIGVGRTKSDLVPADYIRKQTLANEERYITPELKEREARILSAREDLNRLEYDIFVQLRSQVADLAEPIRQVALAVAAADVLANFAELAVRRGYCCPEVTRDRTLVIEGGRHPVVERSLPAGLFVPNDTHLGYPHPEFTEFMEIGEMGESGGDRAPDYTDDRAPDLIILTGPNASGKSCHLRQVGLIQLMAQVGCFVPATRATLGICDRIFTRVGAVDDLATGQSTFMVEMNETANILNHATARSLVLLDEIGRGTATFDGLAIAWSVAEYLAATVRSRTIFATHYHELNELASLLVNVANYQVTVKELPDRIVFLHQVRPGGADRSYGIEAGRLAGLPPSVIDRARQVMAQIEKHSRIAVGLRKTAGTVAAIAPQNGTAIAPDGPAQLDIFS
ncbi:MAG: DNA mismatch repair protein MutS [Cyanobacteria bacterium]|nr:DNA mismatch repair protein MutS [Cyanobacteriota bacterium]